MSTNNKYYIKGNYINVTGNQLVTFNIDKANVSMEQTPYDGLPPTPAETEEPQTETEGPQTENEEPRAPYPPDEVAARVIGQLTKLFAVQTQWAAIYRVMVDCYGKSKKINDFVSWVNSLNMPESKVWKCNYQTIQKALTNNMIGKSFNEWKTFSPPHDDRNFRRNMTIASQLVKMLTKEGFPPISQQE